MHPWPCAIAFSLTLTLLAAAVLLFFDKSDKSTAPLWCLYDIDDPFDLKRSGQFCDIIVLCCLVDERGPDAIATLRAGLVRVGLSLPLLVMPWRDDWFWRRLCSDMVTKEFVELFVDSLSQLDIVGVIHSDTTECPQDALVLEERVLALVKRRKPIRAEILSPNEPQLIARHHGFVSCRSSHVILWDISVIDEQVCRFNVTRSISQARKLRTEHTSVTIVHTISATWKLIHRCLECKTSKRYSLAVKPSLCTAYNVRGSDSIYIRPLARALLLLTTHLSGPFLVINIAEDETAADSVGRPHSTILEQLSRILTKNFTTS